MFLQANSYLVYRLTGQFSIDSSEAGLQHVYDLFTGTYSDEMCKSLGISVDKLPPVKHCSEVVGEVTQLAAEETGLAAGTPVVAGTVDTASAALGSGVVSHGQAFYSVGTSGNLCGCSDHLMVDDSFFTFRHASDGFWLLDLLLGTVGACMKWFRDELAGRQTLASDLMRVDPYELISWEAARVTATDEKPIFLPYMAGRRSPTWNDQARGVFFGLSLSTSGPRIARSIMEGCAFELLHNLNALKAQGFEPSEVRIVGGVTKSEVWNQIWADVVGQCVVIPDTLGSPLGAAILAGCGVGVYTSADKAAADIVSVKRVYEPVVAHRQHYADLFEIYLQLSAKLDSEFCCLSASRRKVDSGL